MVSTARARRSIPALGASKIPMEIIMKDNDESTKPLLFISHKHADKQIADVIREFVNLQSGGRISVFQSSSPWADAPKEGRSLNEQLKKALWDASIVILVYTIPDQDWTYCMWECGVATQPESPPARIILFQCMGEAPSVFNDQTNVNARNSEDIQKFTANFLTDPQYFPTLQSPITQFHRDGPEVAQVALNFYQKLQAALPPEPAYPSDDWPASPFLQLEITEEHVKRISEAKVDERLQTVKDIIREESLVTFTDRECERLFGYRSFPRRENFGKLISIWEEKYSQSKSTWIEALCSQVMQASQWQDTTLIWELMKGVNNNRWYAPVLTRVRKIPALKCMQFDIYFFRFDVDDESKSVKAGIPND